MEMLTYMVLLIGFLLGYLVYELFKIRAGGVIAIPLLVIYTMHNVYFFFAILLASLFVYFVLEYIFKKTAIYGRRLLYISFIISIATTVLIMVAMGEYASAFVTIIPGLIGYNFHREKNSTGNLIRSLMLTDIYAIFVILAALLIISFIDFNPSMIQSGAGLLGFTSLVPAELGSMSE